MNDKENVIYLMECYSTIKKHENSFFFSPFVRTWMDLDGIMLSEMSQTEKDKYIMFSYIQRTDGWGWAKCLKDVKRYKLPVTKQTSHENIIYNVVTTVNNIVLHISSC